MPFLKSVKFLDEVVDEIHDEKRLAVETDTIVQRHFDFFGPERSLYDTGNEELIDLYNSFVMGKLTRSEDRFKREILKLIRRSLKGSGGVSLEDNAIRCYIMKVIREGRLTRWQKQISVIQPLTQKVFDFCLALRRAGFVIRDLKPLNLYVNLVKHGDSLQPRNIKEVGAIDIELGLRINHLGRGRLIVGGTPYYANITQFMELPILKEMYGERTTAVVAHQDTYALAAILYNVVTRKLFFRNSARLINAMVELNHSRYTGKKLSASADYVLDKLKTNNIGFFQLFWQEAKEEFNRALEEDKKRLQKITVTLPRSETRTVYDVSKSLFNNVYKSCQQVQTIHPLFGVPPGSGTQQKWF